MRERALRPVAATGPGGKRGMGELVVSAGGYQDWYIGLALSFVVIVVVVVIVAMILTMAARIADQSGQALTGVDVVRSQTTSLDGGVDKVNDSAVRILHMARVLRKVAVGK
jgi:hypothetical protein